MFSRRCNEVLLGSTNWDEPDIETLSGVLPIS
jgi:hypothetical protein